MRVRLFWYICLVYLVICLNGCALFIDNSKNWVGKDAMALAPFFGDGYVREHANGSRSVLFHRTGTYQSIEYGEETRYNPKTNAFERRQVAKEVQLQYNCVMQFDVDVNNTIIEVHFDGLACSEAFPERHSLLWTE